MRAVSVLARLGNSRLCRLRVSRVQMPTFMAFKSGQKVKEVVGANPPALQVRVCPSLLQLLMLTAPRLLQGLVNSFKA